MVVALVPVVRCRYYETPLPASRAVVPSVPLNRQANGPDIHGVGVERQSVVIGARRDMVTRSRLRPVGQVIVACLASPIRAAANQISGGRTPTIARAASVVNLEGGR